MLRIRLIFLLIIFIALSVAFAAESITITTYYPSPYGAYNELSARRFVVGDDVTPNDDGVIQFQALDVPPLNSAKEGALYYNRSYHAFNYHNGEEWLLVGLLMERGRLNTKGIGAYEVVFNRPFKNMPLIKIYHSLPGRPGGFDDFGEWGYIISNVSKKGFKLIQQARWNYPVIYEWIAIGD